MRDDHEELLARNPALLSRCFWHLARKYGETAEGRAPGLPIFLVSAGLLFHRDTVDKIHRMNFDSRFLKVVAERPDLIGGLQSRVEGAFSASLSALQVGVTAGLFQRDGGKGFPAFRALGGVDLPVALRDASLAEMIAAARRLGAWFALEPFEVIQRQLVIEF
ncbi:three component ABC system middle component [Bradyrhizobium sp. 200]|uniref:three component ABC system middle component n=1 Tax=Bradyrhizobium sp. 200 TaxID=2782665 RepID=UPI001FFEAC2F|nr:three component ABC system middle component [Bradyrhizobium sp. 200]